MLSIPFSPPLAGHQSPGDNHSSAASLTDSTTCHHVLWCHSHLWSKCGKWVCGERGGGRWEGSVHICLYSYVGSKFPSRFECNFYPCAHTQQSSQTPRTTKSLHLHWVNACTTTCVRGWKRTQTSSQRGFPTLRTFMSQGSRQLAKFTHRQRLVLNFKAPIILILISALHNDSVLFPGHWINLHDFRVAQF